jgi:hypothetical protein
MNISLHVVYEGDIGRPLTAAKTQDRELIKLAAKTVIYEAFKRAKKISESDKFLGDVQKEEAERLRKVLGIMIPDLANEEFIDDRVD